MKTYDFGRLISCLKITLYEIRIFQNRCILPGSDSPVLPVHDPACGKCDAEQALQRAFPFLRTRTVGGDLHEGESLIDQQTLNLTDGFLLPAQQPDESYTAVLPAWGRRDSCPKRP